ncbi:MAG: hypothetical protein Q4B52_08290 [Tissierellia bacterium]|nr:hypothetical protein [Tissierellia bacterium]
MNTKEKAIYYRRSSRIVIALFIVFVAFFIIADKLNFSLDVMRKIFSAGLLFWVILYVSLISKAKKYEKLFWEKKNN